MTLQDVRKEGRRLGWGETITVYHDPITRLQPEGKAVIMQGTHRHRDDEDGLNRFMVTFTDDIHSDASVSPQYERVIHADQMAS